MTPLSPYLSNILSMKYCSAGRVLLSWLSSAAPAAARLAVFRSRSPVEPVLHSASARTTTTLVVNMFTTNVRARGSHGGTLSAPAAVPRLRTTLSVDQLQQRSVERDNVTRRVALAHRPTTLLFVYLFGIYVNNKIAK